MNFVPWDTLTQYVDAALSSKFADSVVKNVAFVLVMLGVPSTHTPDAEQISLTVTAVFFTLFSYWYWLGLSIIIIFLKF